MKLKFIISFLIISCSAQAFEKNNELLLRKAALTYQELTDSQLSSQGFKLQNITVAGAELGTVVGAQEYDDCFYGIDQQILPVMPPPVRALYDILLESQFIRELILKKLEIHLMHFVDIQIRLHRKK